MNTAHAITLVNRHTVAQAIAQARKDCAHSIRWLNAVNRAALELEVGGWAFDGATLRMPSATNPTTRYTVDAHGCTCPAGHAGKPCKHRAAWRLLIKAAEIAQATQPRTPKYSAEDYARIAREAAELA